MDRSCGEKRERDGAPGQRTRGENSKSTKMANVWILPQFLSPSRYFLKLFFGCIVFCFVSVTFLHYVYVNKTPKEKGKTTEDETVAANTVWNITDSPDEHEIPVLMSFVNADNSNSLQMKFKTCVFSMVKLSSAPIVLYVAGDKISQGIAESIVAPLDKKKVRMRHGCQLIIH